VDKRDLVRDSRKRTIDCVVSGSQYPVVYSGLRSSAQLRLRSNGSLKRHRSWTHSNDQSGQVDFGNLRFLCGFMVRNAVTRDTQTYDVGISQAIYLVECVKANGTTRDSQCVTIISLSNP
jgi:hypothetical protein